MHSTNLFEQRIDLIINELRKTLSGMNFEGLDTKVEQSEAV